ncbi:hypothetical protein [Natribacillus halophilus]|uniref:Uncharacterized protein n=1 Tax=Natribacillus halophilus TaxID=549003 RepID=A0A1G8S9M2_9BACI|nr:hypothetical protein [Natribacillus halophilus]SDJ25909.1 hypothetical protein SAMN04488123_12425 [Natribacillus halophilus]
MTKKNTVVNPSKKNSGKLTLIKRTSRTIPAYIKATIKSNEKTIEENERLLTK